MKLTNRRHSFRTTMQASDSAAASLPSAIALPAISDAASIQRAIAAVVQAAAAGTLEAPRARVLLYGLQIAATNARHIAAEKPGESQPAAETACVEVEVVSADAEPEMPQSDSAEEAASVSIAEVEATVEEQMQQECSIDAEEADAPQATQTEAQQPSATEQVEQTEAIEHPEDATQIEQREDAEQPPTPPAATVEEASQAAAPPVVGYASSMQSRLLAFRQRSATS